MRLIVFFASVGFDSPGLAVPAVLITASSLRSSPAPSAFSGSTPMPSSAASITSASKSSMSCVVPA